MKYSPFWKINSNIFNLCALGEIAHFCTMSTKTTKKRPTAVRLLQMSVERVDEVENLFNSLYIIQWHYLNHTKHRKWSSTHDTVKIYNVSKKEKRQKEWVRERSPFSFFFFIFFPSATYLKLYWGIMLENTTTTKVGVRENIVIQKHYAIYDEFTMGDIQWYFPWYRHSNIITF
jgi:hypothetical protein